MIAYCWRNGVIGFGSTLPEGALPLGRGPRKALAEIVSVLATHAYDGVTLKVGGVATADSDEEALGYVAWFRDEVAKGWGGRVAV